MKQSWHIIKLKEENKMSAIENIEFQERIFISGTITNLTGMHIGGSSMEMGIGGADSIVIRDPLTNWPYIPGSSLRGKMRSLFERTTGEMTIKLNDGETVNRVSDLQGPLANGATFKSAGPAMSPESSAARLFGISIDKQKGSRPEDIVPQRLIVRDASLRKQSARRLEKARNTDMPLTEVKTEVNIDRITSKANPRQIERVPAGAVFDFSFIVNLYGQDDRNELIGHLFQCMELLQDDYLGGHGSRGYGRVKFDVQSIAAKSRDNYRDNEAAAPVPDSEISIPQSLCFKGHEEAQ